MMKRKILCLTVAAGLAAFVGFAAAQPTESGPRPPAKRTILQRADVVAAPAQETIFGTVEIPVGAGNPKHSHNGTEIGFVVQGQVRLEIEGQVPRVLGPGDSFLVSRGVPHQSILIGDTPVKLISSWTVDKGGELMIPVK